jgi:hypothetical protein
MQIQTSDGSVRVIVNLDYVYCLATILDTCKHIYSQSNTRLSAFVYSLTTVPCRLLNYYACCTRPCDSFWLILGVVFVTRTKFRTFSLICASCKLAYILAHWLAKLWLWYSPCWRFYWLRLIKVVWRFRSFQQLASVCGWVGRQVDSLFPRGGFGRSCVAPVFPRRS